MSVLSDTTIREYLKAGYIHINPPPIINKGGDPYDPCSIQLHMDKKIQIPNKEMKIALDLNQPGQLKSTIDRNYDHFEISESYELTQGNFILATTTETVYFPTDQVQVLAGRIEGRSSFARAGLLVHFTAPTIHAGFKGHITLELINLSHFPIILRPGLAICQLIVETVRGIPSDTKSQFHNQDTPSGSNTHAP